MDLTNPQVFFLLLLRSSFSLFFLYLSLASFLSPFLQWKILSYFISFFHYLCLIYSFHHSVFISCRLLSAKFLSFLLFSCFIYRTQSDSTFSPLKCYLSGLFRLSMHLNQVVCDCLGWIQVAQDMIQWRHFVNTYCTIWFDNSGNFLTIWATISLCRETLQHVVSWLICLISFN